MVGGTGNKNNIKQLSNFKTLIYNLELTQCIELVRFLWSDENYDLIIGLRGRSHIASSCLCMMFTHPTERRAC